MSHDEMVSLLRELHASNGPPVKGSGSTISLDIVCGALEMTEQRKIFTPGDDPQVSPHSHWEYIADKGWKNSVNKSIHSQNC